MTPCPMASGACCAACPALSFGPLKTVIGDASKPVEPKATESGKKK
jgi:hypothetical protein